MHQALEERLNILMRDHGDARGHFTLSSGKGESYAAVHGYNTGGPLAAILRHDRPERALATLDQMARRLIRAHWRAREMDGEMPEWAFDAHLLIDSLIRGGGGDPAMLIPDETSDLRRKMLALSLEGVNVGAVEEISGRIECTIESIDGIVVCDQMGKTCVIIKDKGLPRTILPSLRGRGIGEIVSHPLLSKASAVLVNDVELHKTDDGFNLQLMVQDIRTAVRRAPEGRGGWRDIPY